MPTLPAAGGGVPWPCERLASVLLRGVRQDLQRPDGDAVGKPALQGTLVRLRPVAERGGIGAQVGAPVRRRGEHRLPLAASLSAGDHDRYGPSSGGNRRGRRDLCHVQESRKGSRAWKNAAVRQPDAEEPERKPRKRGGKATRRGLSSEQVPVLVAADRTGATISAILPAVNADTIKDVLAPVLGKDTLLVTDGASFYPPCAAMLGVTHETLNQSAGERVRGELHIQTVNSRHERLKTFLRRYRGIATRYLGSYLKWFHLAGLHLDPSPRTCLNAAMGGAETRIA